MCFKNSVAHWLPVTGLDTWAVSSACHSLVGGLGHTSRDGPTSNSQGRFGSSQVGTACSSAGLRVRDTGAQDTKRQITASHNLRTGRTFQQCGHPAWLMQTGVTRLCPGSLCSRGGHLHSCLCQLYSCRDACTHTCACTCRSPWNLTSPLLSGRRHWLS